MRVARALLLAAVLAVLLLPAWAPSALASPEQWLSEQAITGRIRASGAVADAAAGLQPTERGTLHLPAGTDTLRVTLDWTSTPEDAPLLFAVCHGSCWDPDHGTILATANGTAPLELSVPVPEASHVTWELRPQEPGALDVWLHGRANLYDHPDHGPASSQELVASLAPGAPTIGLLGGLAAVLVALATTVATASKPGAPGLLLPLYHRIQPHALLEHDARAAIVEAIGDEPGIHLTALSERTGATMGKLQHHLRMLERGGLVQADKLSGYRCYFLPGQLAGGLREALAAIKAAAPLAVTRMVERQGPLTMSELAESMGLTAPTVTHHVDRLVEAGVLTDEQDGRFRRVQVSELGERALRIGQ